MHRVGTALTFETKLGSFGSLALTARVDTQRLTMFRRNFVINTLREGFEWGQLDNDFLAL